MAEERKNPAVDPEQVPEGQASNPQEPEKTVSLAEMQRRLKLAEEKHQMELAQVKTDVQKQIEDAVAKAKMSDEELQALKEKEKQGVPVNESTLAFVVKDDEEATKLAVTNMANILNIKKREEAKSSAPITSGGTDDRAKGGKDKFASAKITNF